MHENRIVLYSLLAYINDCSDIYSIHDLSDVLIPIIKRSLSQLYENGVTAGLLKDLKQNLDDTYSFNIPYPTLFALLKKISKKINKSGQKKIILNNDGSFNIKKYTFIEFEEIVLKQESKIKALEKSYQHYLKAQDLKIENQPSIYEFLDSNRLSLSNFFTKRIFPDIDSKFIPQANFVKQIQEDDDIFDLIKKIYLGSIISTYFEIDIGSNKNFNIELALDTNFILGLFDLHSEEATHTCNTLISISNKLKFKLSVLDCTIDETKSLLRRIANNLIGFNTFQELDNYSIYSACTRRNLSKTKLQQITDNIEKDLNSYNINIIKVTDDIYEKAKKSDIYKNTRYYPCFCFTLFGFVLNEYWNKG